MSQSTPPAFGTALAALGRLLNEPIGGSKGRREPKNGSSERRTGSVGHRQMRRELYTLLERHPQSRLTMRHLDFVERVLRRESIDAVLMLPLKVLARALTEMESLVWDWSQPGLAEIRSRIAVALKSRRDEPAAVEEKVAERYTTAPPIHADITEVSHDVFEEMERSWTGQLPAEVAAALQAQSAGGTESRH